jgi:hypothetical protein
VRAALLAVLLTVPGLVLAEEGCWVHFFADPDFAQPMDRLNGALYVNSVAPPGFIGRYSEKEYLRRARSVVVGPEARLLAYAEPGFEAEIFAFGPGHKERDLTGLEFARRVASLKVLCQMR